MDSHNLLSSGKLVNVIFVLLLVAILWLVFKKNKFVAAEVIFLYAFIAVLVHFINRSDALYSDVSHGLFGRMNVPLYGLCVTLAAGLQLRVLFLGWKSKRSISGKGSKPTS